MIRASVPKAWRVQRQITSLAKGLEGRDLADALLAGAEVFANEMRSRAPHGATGNLQAGIYAVNAYKSGKPAGARGTTLRPKPNQAIAVSSAPHSHLVEFGRKEVRFGNTLSGIWTTTKRGGKFRWAKGDVHQKGFAMRMKNGVFTKKIAATRKRPFWRPAYWEGRDRALMGMNSVVYTLVEKIEERGS